MVKKMFREDFPDGIDVDESQMEPMKKSGWSLDKPKKAKEDTKPVEEASEEDEKDSGISKGGKVKFGKTKKK